MKQFFLVAFLFLAASAFFVSCESTEIEDRIQLESEIEIESTESYEFLKPEHFEEIATGRTKITLKTDAPKAAVYINNEFHGLTPLEIHNLIPGDYFVTIKKEEYKTMQIAIQIKDGVSDYYYLEMELDLEDEE